MEQLVVVIIVPFLAAIGIIVANRFAAKRMLDNSEKPTSAAIKEIDDRWQASWKRREQECIDTYEGELIGLSGRLQEQIALVEQYKKSEDIQSRLIAQLQDKLQQISELTGASI